MSTVAAFDFDGTLSTRDCVVPFLEQLAGRARLVGGIVVQPLAIADALLRRDRDRFKAVAVRAAFAGREVGPVEQFGGSFAQTVHSGWLRSDTPKRLAWHQREGHKVVLVSASLGAYLHPLGEMLGVDGVLCTEAVVGHDGRYTGEMVGQNCRGPEKVRRLRAWLAEMKLDDAELWAYGDSAGDRELLAAADHDLLVKNRQVPAEPDSTSQASAGPHP